MGFVARADGEISGLQISFCWGQKAKEKHTLFFFFFYPNWLVPRFWEVCQVILGAVVSISYSSGYALILEGVKKQRLLL